MATRTAGLAAFLLLVMSAPAAVNASGALTFLGIHWHMSVDQMMSVLNQEGFRCRSRADDLLGRITQCVRGRSTIEIISRFGTIEFDCHSYDGCDQSQDEVVARLTSLRIISAAEPSGNDYYGALLLCSDGLLGDALCVDSAGSVFLYRARLPAPQ